MSTRDDAGNKPRMSVGAWVARALRLTILARVALIGWGVLSIGPLLASGSQLTSNLFAVDQPVEFLLISMLLLLASLQCGYILTLVLNDAPSRMGDVSPSRSSSPRRRWRLVVALAMAVPGHVMLIDSFEGSQTITLWLAMAGTVAAALGINALTVFSGRRFAESALPKAWTPFLRALPTGITAGYINDHDGRTFLRSTHAMAFVLLLTLLVIYLTVGVVFAPDQQRTIQPPAIVYLLLLFMTLTMFLGGLAFFLDRYRIPLLLALVGLTLVNSFTAGPKLLPLHEISARPLANPESVVLRRAPNSDERFDRTLIVVCASGGGIQSCAWTANVLTWLQEDLGEDFTRSTRFYSGVSGGSLGLAYVLEALNPETGAMHAEYLDDVRAIASRRSLPSVTWGMCYPDFLRALIPWLPLVMNPYLDRGWAIENRWRHIQTEDWNTVVQTRWSDWVSGASEQGFPGVAFNSLDAKTGRRIVFSNVDIPHGDETVDAETVGMMDLGGAPDHFDLDIDIMTSARASATFPYVTPIATASLQTEVESTPTPELEPVAFADGGYFDNTGFLTAIEWLRAVLPTQSDQFDHIVVVEIRAFPRESQGEDKRGALESWTLGAVGPLLAVLNTRGTSQIARGEFELDLLRDRHETIKHVYFEPSDDRAWSLSWQLSNRQIEDLAAQRKHGYAEGLAKLKSALSLE